MAPEVKNVPKGPSEVMGEAERGTRKALGSQLGCPGSHL